MALDNDALGVLLADTRIDTDAGTDIEVQAFQENITLATAEVAALSPSIALTVGDEAANIRIVTGQLQQGDGADHLHKFVIMAGQFPQLRRNLFVPQIPQTLDGGQNQPLSIHESLDLFGQRRIPGFPHGDDGVLPAGADLYGQSLFQDLHRPGLPDLPQDQERFIPDRLVVLRFPSTLLQNRAERLKGGEGLCIAA